MNADQMRETLKAFFVCDGQFYWDEACWYQSELFGRDLAEEQRHLAALQLRDWLRGGDSVERQGALYLANFSLAAPECGPELIALVRDRHLGGDAVTALGKAKYAQAIPVLRELLSGLNGDLPAWARAREAARALAEMDVTLAVECTIMCVSSDLREGRGLGLLHSNASATVMPLSPLVCDHRERGLRVLLWKLKEEPEEVQSYAVGALLKFIEHERQFSPKQRGAGIRDVCSDEELDAMLAVVRAFPLHT